MLYPTQTLTNREVRIPGAFKKDYNAKMPKPKAFDPDLYLRALAAEEARRPPEITVPNQLPDPGFGLPEIPSQSYPMEEYPEIELIGGVYRR